MTQPSKEVQRRSCEKHRAQRAARRAAAWAALTPAERLQRGRDQREARRDYYAKHAREYHATHRDTQIAKMKARTDELSPSYLASKLKLRLADVTPELLALKREQMTLYRLGKQLKAQIKESK